MMDLTVVLLCVASLSFMSVWLLMKRILGAQEALMQQERLKMRVGLASAYGQQRAQREQGCGWCRLGMWLGPKSIKELNKTQQQLASAGFRDESHLGAYFFIKYASLAAVGLIMAGLWSWFGLRLEWVILAMIITLLVPERIVIMLGQRRLDKVSTHLPDFLDMCTICMNAGLSYLVAIQRVADELKDVHPEISYEFIYLLDQIQMGVPRTEALRQFAERNPTKEIQNLVQVLVQNEKLGSSISEALTEFSRRMYQDREHTMEEKAAKTSAKMAVVIMPFLMSPYLILLLGERMVMLGRGF